MNATSYSDINTYQRCPEKYRLRVIENIEPKTHSLALFDGINAHALMQEWFLGLQMYPFSPAEAWERVEALGQNMIDEHRETMFTNELADAEIQLKLILAIVKRYVEQYMEEWEVLHVEEQFIVMLDSGRVISFTPDLVVRDRNGYVWIVDHKTTSRMPEKGLPVGDMQAFLYYAGVKALYPELRGFIFNRLRKKLPTQPRLTKTGKTRVADLARIDTTYEILRDFLQEKAPGLLDEPMHQRRLAQLRDQGNKFFWTEEVYVADEAVEQVLQDAETVMEWIEISEQTDRFPRSFQEDGGYKSCRKCPYARICQSEMLGWDTERIIADEYQERGEKNPYESEDE